MTLPLFHFFAASGDSSFVGRIKTDDHAVQIEPLDYLRGDEGQRLYAILQPGTYVFRGIEASTLENEKIESGIAELTEPGRMIILEHVDIVDIFTRGHGHEMTVDDLRKMGVAVDDDEEAQPPAEQPAAAPIDHMSAVLAQMRAISAGKNG
jgi:hypothetical protein